MIKKYFRIGGEDCVLCHIIAPPALVFFVHVALLSVVGIYQFWPWFDIVTHFAGGASIAIASVAFLQLVQGKQATKSMPLLLWLLIIVSFVSLAAVAWEFLEFLATHFAKIPLQGNLQDTIGDLFIGLLGGLFAAVLVRKRK